MSAVCAVSWCAAMTNRTYCAIHEQRRVMTHETQKTWLQRLAQEDRDAKRQRDAEQFAQREAAAKEKQAGARSQ